MSNASANENRLEHIDLVRGYALLGVLLMNIQYWFRNPPQLYWANPHPFAGTLNAAVDQVLKVWFEGKSVTLFAMLFAIGLCIQRASIVAKELSWGGYAFRRLGAMAGFGALHILLFWNGDVLHQYAVTGLLILPFLKRKPRTLSWWAGTLIGLALLGLVAYTVFTAFRPPSPDFASGGDPVERNRMIQTLVHGYSQHSWTAVLRTRLWDWLKLQRMMLPMVPIWLFVTFLVGLWIWSRGVLQDPSTHKTRIGRAAAWGLGVGLATNVMAAYMPAILQFLKGHWGWAKLLLPLLGFSQAFGPLLLAIGIGAGLVWLWQHPQWRERLRPLTFVGRMGFTNYILQSVVCSFIFYGWGLGLYNRVGPAVGTLIGLALFAAQIPFSRWWLQRFHFGPLEWCWRTLTYGHTSAFRRLPVMQPQAAEG
jgi:uncharacterized protein